ncbi:MAG: ABC transporter permease [Candidatus Obscuribacterales bacterium]|jgi:peptide/nickel transport system permease protein|nr:ABC transporter permease [Candidatus Obscuribacterales bacterium]
MSIPTYLLKRMLQALPLLFIISVMSFTMLKLAPIDPLAYLKANPAISAAAIKAEEERLGLNKPPVVQYFLWMSNLFQGDLGVSVTGGSVSTLLLQRAGNTLLLSSLSIFFTWLIAIPGGIWAAVHRGKFIDKFWSVLSGIAMAMPAFLFAMIFLMIALATDWFPIGGLTSADHYELDAFQRILDLAHHLIIPVTVLTFVNIAHIQRQMRGNLLDVLKAEYVRTARAKGLPENEVIYKHALRNAINPLLTLLGFEFAALLSGAALTETVLAYPGLGRLTLEAVQTKDMNLVMASIMLGALMLILGNLLADVLLKVADPRITLE